MEECGSDSVKLRDARYDQVVHMMTAASGAEDYYQTENNPARSEGLTLARELDNKAAIVREGRKRGEGWEREGEGGGGREGEERKGRGRGGKGEKRGRKRDEKRRGRNKYRISPSRRGWGTLITMWLTIPLTLRRRSFESSH